MFNVIIGCLLTACIPTVSVSQPKAVVSIIEQEQTLKGLLGNTVKDSSETFANPLRTQKAHVVESTKFDSDVVGSDR